MSRIFTCNYWDVIAAGEKGNVIKYILSKQVQRISEIFSIYIYIGVGGDRRGVKSYLFIKPTSVFNFNIRLAM